MALVALLVFAIYYPSQFAPFTSLDDMRMISHLLNSDISLKDVFLPNGTGTYYRPLLYLTFVIDKYVWGLEPSFMHLENILLHVANSVLVFSLARYLLTSLSLNPVNSPLAIALLFGLHPIATEPVNWVSGRTDLLAGLFVFLFLLYLLKWYRSFSLWDITFASIFLFAGCMSKETPLFILPVVLLRVVFTKSSAENDLTFNRRCLVSFFLISSAASYLTLRWFVLKGGDRVAKKVDAVGVTLHDEPVRGFLEVCRVVVETAGFYFKKLVIPTPLNFGIDSISPNYFLPGTIVCCLAVWCIFRRDAVSYLFLAAFAFISSAFIPPILKITWAPFAERYIYIAAAPFIMAVALFFLKYVNRSVPAWLTTIVTASLLGGASLVTAERNVIWQDNYTLFKDTMEKSPQFGPVINEYALALRERGEFGEADRIMLSNRVDEFQVSSLNRIRVLTEHGELSQARSLLMERINRGSEYNKEMLELLVTIDELRRANAVTKGAQHSIDRQILDTFQKLKALTGDPFISYRMGKVYLAIGDRLSAKRSFTQAWQGSPKESHYHDAARKLAERL